MPDEAPPQTSIILYQTGEGPRIQCRFENEMTYPRENEINELSRIVVMFLDLADQARRRKQIFLHNWQTGLDDFLPLNERAILPVIG